MGLDTSPVKDGSTTSVESKTESLSSPTCRCSEGFHGCWAGECDCTTCNYTQKEQPRQRRPRNSQTPKPKPPKGVPHPIGKVTPLPEDLVEYIALRLLEDAGSPHRISQPEWDAVHRRFEWTHKEVAIDLGLTYERVRYIRRMSRPDDTHVAPAYRDIAYHAGCTVSQVYKVMRDLVVLRDAERPENGASFS